jgi:hypothetical protein
MYPAKALSGPINENTPVMTAVIAIDMIILFDIFFISFV